jgi:hypothetical protein
VPPQPLDQVTRDLEALKERLVALTAGDVTLEETEAMGRQIGAIRLQLKRLRADQDACLNELSQLRFLEPL